MMKNMTKKIKKELLEDYALKYISKDYGWTIFTSTILDKTIYLTSLGLLSNVGWKFNNVKDWINFEQEENTGINLQYLLEHIKALKQYTEQQALQQQIAIVQYKPARKFKL